MLGAPLTSAGDAGPRRTLIRVSVGAARKTSFRSEEKTPSPLRNLSCPSAGFSTGDGGTSAATGGPQGDLDEGPHPLYELHVRPVESRELLGLGSLDLGWVVESPVE